jgi:hypothetical protein
MYHFYKKTSVKDWKLTNSAASNKNPLFCKTFIVLNHLIEKALDEKPPLIWRK